MLHKNKKGFTLIELLAVIVILAIIALIAVPIILNMLEDSKKASAKVGTTHYVDTLEKELMYEDFKQDINPEGMYLLKEDGTYEVNGKVKKLSIKGSLPTSGTICVDEKGMVDSYSVVLDGYVVTKTGEEQEIEKGTVQKSITCNVAEEIVEIKIPENSNICSQTKEVVINYPHYEATVKEYSLDRKQWLEYKEPVIMKENGTLYARLRDKRNNKVSSVATITFTTIDNEQVSKTAPSVKLSEEKPTSEINVTFKQTDNCGLKEVDLTEKEKKKYGISEIKDGEYTWQEEAVFKELKNNTTYYIKTRANDIANNDIVDSDISEIKTGEFEGITITPSSTVWTPSKTVTISGSTTGAELQYRVLNGSTEKVAWTKYEKEITIDWTSTTTTPTYVYARFYDGKNYSNEETLTITTVDATSPNLSLGTAITTTKSITIPISINSDNESEIKSTTCKLGTSNGSYTINGTISNNTCTATNLTNNVTYYYQVVTTNNAGLSTTKTGSTKTEQFKGITITPSSTAWTTSKTVTIAGTTSGATLQYRVVSGSTQKVAWTTYSGAITINWTATTSTPTYVYARFYDGKNYSNETSLTITTIDRDKPTTPTVTYNSGSNSCSWKNNYNITLSASDISVAHYEIDVNGDGGSDGTTGANFIPSNGWSSCNVRFRAVDHVGNRSGWTAVHHIHQDTQAPGTPTVTYNSGSNSCSWKNNYNITLSSSENIGVGSYEIDWNGDGGADATIGASFIPGNGYHSCNTRFRAVDHAGNKSAWTAVHHIHMDTQAPGKTSVNLNGYSSGAWTRGNVTQTASATDNVGIAYYQYSHDGVNVATNFPSNPWTINWDGQWNFYVRAVDHAGNAGAWSNVYTIRRDTVAPSISNISNNSGSNWTRNNVTISYTSSDAASGVNRVVYSYNQSTELTDISTTGGTWSADRNNNVYLRVYDNAGNASGWYSAGAVRIDKSGPSISMEPVSGTYTAGSTTVAVYCSDAGVGMQANTGAYLEDKGYVTQGTSSTSQSLASSGSRTATGRCTDSLGNVTTATRSYNITYSGGYATGCYCEGGCACGGGTATTECKKACGL